MAITTVSVSFANGFVGDYSKNNESTNASLTSALGWSNLQFVQSTDNGQFGGTQGNDYTGTILVTDANGVQHAIDGVINWRAPSGAVSTIVFYATGSSHTLATTTGTYVVDPFTEQNGDPHSFIGLTFNGQALTITGGKVTGNAATSGLLSTLNTYLADQPQISVSDVAVNEGSGMATVTVTLSKATSDTVTVNYTTGNGTAAAGTDYTAASGTLTFSPNQTTKTFQVPILDNQLVDGTRSFNVVLSNSTMAAITDNTGTVTVSDNDVAQTVSAVLAEDAAHTGANPVDSSVVEGNSLAYTVSLSVAAGSSQEYALSLGGTASAADYGAVSFSDGVAWKGGNATSGIIVIPSGVTSFKVTIATADDSSIESAESLVLTVGGVAATGTITDNDAPSVSAVLAEDAANAGATPADSAVVEGASLQYSVTLSAAGLVSSEFTLVKGGTAAAGDLGAMSFSDGVAWKNGDASTGIIVVPAGVASFKIIVATVDDTQLEAAESLVLTVGGVAATGTITDNDVQSVSAVLAEDASHTGATPTDSTVEEGASLQYAVTLSAAGISAGEFTLAIGGTAAGADAGSLSFSDGVAWKNGDAGTGIIVVPAGVASFKITVATVDDAVIESAESLVLTVGGVAATGTITDNDVQSVSAVLAEDAANTGATPTDSAVEEGAALQYTVTLSAAGVAAGEFSLALGGTAAGADVGALSFSDGVAWKNGDAGTGIIVVPAGVASFKVIVATVDDAAIESAESVVLTVGGVAATGTITDNDSLSVASVSAAGAATVAEGTDLQYTVALNAAAMAPAEFSLGVGGTASGPDVGAFSFSDGVAWKDGNAATGILVVPAGVAGFSVTVATVDDAAIESAESLVLTVGGVASTGTITDNDSHSVTSVTAASSVVEGNGLQYTVALNAANPAASEFSLGIGGTAADVDFGALVFSDGVAWKAGDPTSGVIVVPANVTGFTISVATIDDALVEVPESLVLTVGGVAATGTINDNDVAPPVVVPPVVVVPPPVVVPPVVVEPPPVVVPPVVVEPPPVVVPPVVVTPPVVPPVPPFGAVLDPATDDGHSNADAITSVIKPEFTVSGAGYFTVGGTARLTTTDGIVLSSAGIGVEAMQAGKINLATPALDDGEYTFISQVLDANGKVVAESPVKVTIVTDVDGVAPSIELAANGGDFNRDGIMDWQQHAVAQMPLASLADYALGKNASDAAFGAIIAGTPDAANPGAAVKLTAGAQLLDLSLSAAPAALDPHTLAASPMFNFSVKPQEGGEQLADMDPTIAGLQTRVVIELAAGGVQANDFIKWDKVNQRWYSFLDDQRLDTFDNGATLVDANGDGKVDRIVITLTDGGWGDEDGVANGVIVDPGMLAQKTAAPVFSILLANGDRCYTTSAQEAAALAKGTGNLFEGARFDALDAAEGGRQLNAFFQPYTKDWYYAAAGDSMPYACYQLVPGAGFTAAAAGSGIGIDIHLFQNGMGQTQLLSQADAQALGLAGKGFKDLGAKFSATNESAFAFDVEGYLVANRGNASVQALVQSLAGSYHSTSDAGFIEAVEQNYLAQVSLVGLAHGGAATAADLNAVFGTAFGA